MVAENVLFEVHRPSSPPYTCLRNKWTEHCVRITRYFEIGVAPAACDCLSVSLYVSTYKVGVATVAVVYTKIEYVTLGLLPGIGGQEKLFAPCSCG